ncbi:MAG: hypothetical protein AB1728_14105 [Bacteroidota bacterium]
MDETYNERVYRIWLHTPSSKHSLCNKCKSEIIWMKTERGKNIPVNPRKVSLKRLFEQPLQLIDRHGRMVRRASFDGYGWEVHYSTCTGPTYETQQNHSHF